MYASIEKAPKIVDETGTTTQPMHLFSSCTCAPEEGEGTDTITVVMEPTNPRFVVEYGIGADLTFNDLGEVVFDVTANTFNVTIGDVVCCERLD